MQALRVRQKQIGPPPQERQKYFVCDTHFINQGD
jgi:hypothetical protein